MPASWSLPRNAASIDPWGEVLLDMGTGNGVGFADISIADVDAVRQRVPVIAHRRPIPEVTRLT